MHFKKDNASSMRKAAFVKFKSPVTSPALWIRQVCMAMRFQTWQTFSPCEANKNPVKTIQNLWHGSQYWLQVKDNFFCLMIKFPGRLFEQTGTILFKWMMEWRWIHPRVKWCNNSCLAEDKKKTQQQLKRYLTEEVGGGRFDSYLKLWNLFNSAFAPPQETVKTAITVFFYKGLLESWNLVGVLMWGTTVPEQNDSSNRYFVATGQEFEEHVSRMSLQTELQYLASCHMPWQ